MPNPAEKGTFSKVVLSRNEIVDLPNFDLISLYIKLASSYPSAFTYCWFHPEIGLWMGATPETLLKVNSNQFQTVALAGTQLYKGSEEVIWQNKEKEEQQFVTDYIVEIIGKLVSEIQISIPKTKELKKRAATTLTDPVQIVDSQKDLSIEDVINII